MRLIAVAVFATVCCVQPLLSPVAGQSVLVQVTESESGRPIAGAFVSLMDQEGRLVRSALTNDSGRFLFPVSGAGVFWVKAEIIGRATVISSPLTLGAGESGRITLALPFHAISLAGIRVEADAVCRLRPDEASEIARVWDEARKALTVQAWTEDEGFYRLQISTYDRDLDGRGRRVERENRRGSNVVTRTPFASLPVGELMAGGFVRTLEDGGYQYYGPDAPTLLSDLFLDTHCLRLTRSNDNPGAIGLAFEPVRAGDLPDIQGTLWLDEATAHLQFLEYDYTWAPYREARGVAGGRVEFEAMPNGAWIIDRWWIRAPIMAVNPQMARAGDSGIRVAGIRETGGEVIGISTMDRQRIAEVERGSLGGVVWDSTLSSPLAGANVYLSGTQYSGVTDAEGRFLVEGVPEGVFTASFTHPRLDSLGILASGAEVEISRGETLELHFGIPAITTIRLAACRAALEEGEGPAALSGIVRDRTSGEPIPGATVRVEWQNVRRVFPRPWAGEEWFEVQTDALGRYMACGIPLDENLYIRALFLEEEGEVIRQRFPEDAEEEHRVLDLEIELPPGFLSVRSEILSVEETMGGQGVQGVLTEPGSGTPIRSAEVILRDGSGRIRVTGETNERGFFRLQTPMTGRHLFSARALGYAEVQDEVLEISVGKLTVLDIQMAPEALELEALVVTAEARTYHLEMQGFYDRQTLGLTNGVFMSPEHIERRRPRQLTDLFFGLPGTRVMEPSLGAGGRAVYFRSGDRPNGICWPMVFVDRHLASPGGLAGGEPLAVDEVVQALDVSAIEVYRSPAGIPSEFNGPNAGCGVIVIWTHRGGGG